jgi:hypothetical protein
VKHQCNIFYAQVGLVRIPQKACRAMLCDTCVFGASSIYRSRSAVSCVWGVKHQRTIFMLGLARCRSQKKRMGTHYAEFVFVHLVGSTGHVGHSSASEMRNVNLLFFMIGWAQCGPHKNREETCYAKLVFFCIQWDLRVT